MPRARRRVPIPADAQRAQGSYIAQAKGRSKAVVNVKNIYRFTRPKPPDEAALASALQLAVQLPTTALPSLAPLPPSSRMPFTANDVFVGREQDFKAIATVLKVRSDDSSHAPLTVAVTGLGGMGKTQLAVEFVHRYGQFFAGGIFWLSFADPQAAPAQIALCGGPGYLDLRPNFASLSLEAQVNLVFSAWQSPLPRLLVFDNCEEEDLLARSRPTTGGCRVLITSRRAVWDPVLGVRVVPLDVLPRADSISLLRKHRPDIPPDEPDLDDIAEELGDLPLALHLAGSYLARYRLSLTPGNYLQQLRNPGLLNHPAMQGKHSKYSPTSHERNVARTFALSYDRLDPEEATDAEALQLLARASYFAPGVPIPRGLLLATLPTAQASSTDNSEAGIQAEDALLRLVELGLLETEAEGALKLHRLLALFVRDTLSQPDMVQPQAQPQSAQAQHDVELLMYRIANTLNAEGYAGVLLPLQPHLRFITDAAMQREDELTANLCSALDCHLSLAADYSGALPYSERALAIHQRIFGPDHPNTAASLNNLALLLKQQGDYQAAKLLYERALSIREKVLGPDHPDTATSLNNLALLLHAQGDYQAAKLLYERALSVSEKVLGPDHPDTAASLSNLALLLQDQGNVQQVEPLMRRALYILERSLGPNHPSTQAIRRNLSTMGQEPASSQPFTEDTHISQQITRLQQQVQEAVEQALAQGTLEQRTQLAAQIQQLADRVAEGESEGSPYLGLAVRLRALADQITTAT